MTTRPQLPRHSSAKTVLKLLLEHPATSRAELARITGLSKQTMSNAVKHLEDCGWLHVVGRDQGPLGRSAITYEVVGRQVLIFGVDVGGTKVHAAISDLSGVIIKEVIEPTDSSGGTRLIDQIANLYHGLLAETDLGQAALKVASVGLPGAVHPRTGRLSMLPNVPGITGLDFAHDLETKLGFRTILDNDVNLAAVGEHRLGHGLGLDSFVFVALGTGIGMGIINEGRLVHGAKGAAGEISTLPLGADPFDARSFFSGALETSISSAAIRSRYYALGGAPGFSVKDIFENSEDFKCLTVIDEVARVVALAISAVSAVVDPEMVVFGGSVGAQSEFLTKVQSHLARCCGSPPKCVISAMGSSAGLKGAMQRGREDVHETLFSNIDDEVISNKGYGDAH